MNPQTLARVALDLIAHSSIAPTDESLAVAAQTRAMLHRIANGTLVVTERRDPPPDIPQEQG